MFLRRQLPRARRGLLVAAVAATVVLVPRVAWADPPAPSDPGAGVAGALGAVGGALGNTSTTGAGTDSSSTNTSSTNTSSTDTSGKGTNPASTNPAAADSSPAVPSFDSSQLQALLSQLHVPASCASTVQADLTKTLTDIPTTLTNLVTQIVTTLSGSGGDPSGSITTILTNLGLPVPGAGSGTGTGTGDTTATGSGGSGSGVLIVDDLQQLIKDFQANCIPAAPTSASAPTSSAAPISEQPVESAAPPLAQAQPVTYPGYAPTGAIATPDSGGTGPDTGLAALGGGVLLAAAAATAAVRIRSRAARGGR